MRRVIGGCQSGGRYQCQGPAHGGQVQGAAQHTSGEDEKAVLTVGKSLGGCAAIDYTLVGERKILPVKPIVNNHRIGESVDISTVNSHTSTLQKSLTDAILYLNLLSPGSESLCAFERHVTCLLLAIER